MYTFVGFLFVCLLHGAGGLDPARTSCMLGKCTTTKYTSLSLFLCFICPRTSNVFIVNALLILIQEKAIQISYRSVQGIVGIPGNKEALDKNHVVIKGYYVTTYD